MVPDASFTLTFDPESSTVVIRVDGPVDSVVHGEIFQAIAAQYDMTRTNFLWDLTDASFSRFTINEVKAIRQIRQEYAHDRRNVASAIWIRDAYAVTLVRLFEELNKGVSPQAAIVFSEADARAHLGIAEGFKLSHD